MKQATFYEGKQTFEHVTTVHITCRNTQYSCAFRPFLFPVLKMESCISEQVVHRETGVVDLVLLPKDRPLAIARHVDADLQIQ